MRRRETGNRRGKPRKWLFLVSSVSSRERFIANFRVSINAASEHHALPEQRTFRDRKLEISRAHLSNPPFPPPSPSSPFWSPFFLFFYSLFSLSFLRTLPIFSPRRWDSVFFTKLISKKALGSVININRNEIF